MSNEFINLGSTKNHEDFQLRYISFSKYEGDWQNFSMFSMERVFSI